MVITDMWQESICVRFRMWKTRWAPNDSNERSLGSELVVLDSVFAAGILILGLEDSWRHSIVQIITSYTSWRSKSQFILYRLEFRWSKFRSFKNSISPGQLGSNLWELLLQLRTLKVLHSPYSPIKSNQVRCCPWSLLLNEGNHQSVHLSSEKLKIGCCTVHTHCLTGRLGLPRMLMENS